MFVRVAALTGGALLGGFATGTAISGVVAAGVRVPSPLFAALALLTLLVAVGALPDVLPSSRWRVPQRWGRFGLVPWSGLFGFCLGLGFATARPAASFWLLVTAPFVVGRPATAIVAMSVFGAARAGAVIAVANGADLEAELLRLTRLRVLAVVEAVLVVGLAAAVIARLP